MGRRFLLPPFTLTWKPFILITRYLFFVKNISSVIGVKTKDERNTRDLSPHFIQNMRHFDVSYKGAHGGNHFGIVIRWSFNLEIGTKSETISFKHCISQMVYEKY